MHKNSIEQNLEESLISTFQSLIGKRLMSSILYGGLKYNSSMVQGGVSYKSEKNLVLDFASPKKENTLLQFHCSEYTEVSIVGLLWKLNIQADIVKYKHPYFSYYGENQLWQYKRNNEGDKEKSVIMESIAPHLFIGMGQIVESIEVFGMKTNRNSIDEVDTELKDDLNLDIVQFPFSVNVIMALVVHFENGDFCLISGERNNHIGIYPLSKLYKDTFFREQKQSVNIFNEPMFDLKYRFS